MKGEYQHTLDAKGRLFIPAKLREQLGDGFVVTKGLDESSAADVTVDRQGRIVIPTTLRSYANLERDVVVIGVGERAELWDARRWNAYTDDLDCESIAQAMEELGF